MERFLQALADNPQALKRLEEILNHTGSDENGERLYVNVADAAEVYALVFAAWSDGPDGLTLLTDNMTDDADSGSAISGAMIHAVIHHEPASWGGEEDEEAAKEYVAIQWPTGTKEIELEIDLT